MKKLVTVTCHDNESFIICVIREFETIIDFLSLTLFLYYHSISSLRLLVLRNSETDKSQRMLNAVEPGSIMPIHRHPNTSTTVIIIRGKIRQNFYDDNGNMVETVLLDANGLNRAVQIEKERWHNLESFESGSVLFEAKDGEWEPYELLEK